MQAYTSITSYIANYYHASHLRPDHQRNCIGVGDGGREGTCPPKIREKYFSGNYYVKFGHFSGKNVLPPPEVDSAQTPMHNWNNFILRNRIKFGSRLCMAVYLSSWVASASAVWTQFASSRRLPMDSIDNLETGETDSVAVWQLEFWSILITFSTMTSLCRQLSSTTISHQHRKLYTESRLPTAVFIAPTRLNPTVESRRVYGHDKCVYLPLLVNKDFHKCRIRSGWFAKLIRWRIT